MEQTTSIHPGELGSVLLCEVCEGEILTHDEIAGGTGCCTACGIAYLFDDTVELEQAVSS